MGSREGEALVYHWPLYIHLAKLILPLALLALLLRKANRTRDAWLVLIPAFVLPLIVDWGLNVAGVARYLGYIYDAAVITAFWLAFLWLFSNRLFHARRAISFIRAIGLLVLCGMFGFIGISMLQPNADTFVAVAVYGILAFVSLASLALAGWACHKRYSSLRFLLWHFVVTAIFFGSVAAVVINLITFLPPLISEGTVTARFVQFHLLNTTLPVGLGGTALFVAMLPFVSLALWSPTYRPRFHAIFRLPGMDFEHHGAYNDNKTEEYEP